MQTEWQTVYIYPDQTVPSWSGAVWIDLILPKTYLSKNTGSWLYTIKNGVMSCNKRLSTKFDSWQNKIKLELVFVKHYAPNICLSPDMAEFAVS